MEALLHRLFTPCFNMSQQKNNRAKDLETILTICVLLIVLFFVTKKQHAYYLTLSALLGIIGISSKYLSAKISWAWLKLSEGIGFVMNKVILATLFMVLLVPIAMLKKLFSKKDNLQLKKSASTSYYVERNHKYTGKDLEDLW